MSLSLSTALQLLHRPHLITPDAAEEIAARIRAQDPRAFTRSAGPFAFLRKKGLFDRRPQPAAMDDDYGRWEPPTRPSAYQPLWLGKADAELEWGWAVKDGVALMSIDTPLVDNGEYACGQWLHGYDTISAAVDEADATASVKGMFMHFKSPGGTASQALYDLCAKLEARGPDAKPIYAYCECAASAAYMMAAAAAKDWELIAPTLGVVGSIGAVMVHESYAGLLEKEGITVTPIQFGEFKTDGASFKALSDSAKATMQAMIDQLGTMFCESVGRTRGGKLTADGARATGARIFYAGHANAELSGLAQGLVDSVMGEQAAFEALKAQLAAPAAIPSIRPATPAERQPAASTANPKETDMKLRAGVSALAKAEGEDDETFKEKLKKLIAEDDEAEAAADDDNKPDDTGGDNAEGSDKPDNDKVAKAKAAGAKPAALTGLARAKAIMNLPEAKGREPQAQEFALDEAYASVPVEKIKAMLAKTPKQTAAPALADRGTDAGLSANGGKKLTQEQQLEDAGFALAGIRPLPRRG